MSPSKREHPIPGGRQLNVQVLRFVAAFMVLIYHVALHYAARKGEAPVGIVKYLGFAGVDIFFVISGYIMWVTTSNLSGPPDAMQFMFRRVVRIFSGYWPVVGMIFFLYVAYAPGNIQTTDWIRGLLLLPTPPRARVLDLSWTLTLEMVFYLAWAIAIASTRRLLVASALGCAMLIFVLLPKSNVYSIGFVQNPIFFEFGIGCLVGCASERGVLGRPMLWLACGIVLMLSAALAFLSIERIPGAWLRVGTYGIASGLILAGVAALEGRVVPIRPLVALGDASFALYLLHMPVLQFAWGFLPKGHDVWFFHDNLELGAAFIVAGSVVLSLFYFRLVERPLILSAKRLLDRRLIARLPHPP